MIKFNIRFELLIRITKYQTMKKSVILFFSVLLLSTGKLTAQLCISLAPGSTDKTIVCVNSPIVDVVYNLHNTVLSIDVGGDGFPTGVSGVLSGNTYTISGTPSVSGVFNYTLTTAGCVETVTGSITVNPLPNVSATNNGPLCQGRDLMLFGGPSGLRHIYGAARHSVHRVRIRLSQM